MSLWLTDNLYFYYSAEVLLSLYLLCFIFYTLILNNLINLSYPPLLASMVSATVFIIISIILLFAVNDGQITGNLLSNISNVTLLNLAFKVLLLLSVIMLQLVSRKILKSLLVFKYEYDLLIVFAILGLALLNECDDFLMFYLAIELQSLSFYVLATFNKQTEFNAESGLKYFILGALSSCFLLYGFSLVYIVFGSIEFQSVTKFSVSNTFTIYWSFSFIFIALFFKLGVFPFHQWLCDVYEGSLITVTAFFAIVPKVIIFSVFLKLTCNIFISFYKKTGFIVAFFSLSSISFASVTALFQKRLKRLLAYSAISHTGFILLAISCNSIESFKAFIVYIVVYIIMTTAVFTLIFISSNNAAIPKYLTNWTSFASQNVLVAFTFGIMLFSMAGIPPFAGFFSKLCVFFCLLSKSYVFSSICVAFFSSVACFYYIRLIKVFFFVDGSKNSYWVGYSNSFDQIYASFAIFFVAALLNHLPSLLNVAFLVSFSII